jgi:single-stranded DNA-binding protein
MTPIAKNGSTIMWGRVTSGEASYKELPSGKHVSNFSIQYDSLPSDDGKRKGVYVDCTAWNDLADFAKNLERGDVVLCAGRMERDSYSSEKKGEDVYRLICEFISVMH